jgi:O-acetyl-ADP-ribose deacetylase (regulator of RNase III)
MNKIKGSIFEGEWNGMVHCANLYHTFGAGIAKIIKSKYPKAFEADLETDYGYKSDKLGWFSVGREETDAGEIKSIFNLYAQEGIGPTGRSFNRNCRYDDLHDGVWRICESINDDLKEDETYTLAFPHGMCCGLAGGDWNIAEAILHSVSKRFPKIKFVVYEL